jgi:hypothetical protein
MKRAMTHALKLLAAALLGCILLAAAAEAQTVAGPDDTAKLLAGMPVPAGSPLARFAEDRAWQQHATVMDKTWGDLEKRQLSPIRTWSQTNLTARRPVTFYFFSGPDFLYVDSFFPDSDVYVLAGLEPTGGLPDVTRIRSGALPGEYGKLRGSMRSILNLSYFITREMDQDLRASQLRGTLPILYVFMARTGKTIHDVSFVALDPDGTEQADSGDKSAARGVKIVFSGAGGRRQTLYYFRTDLSNGGLVRNGFLAFCDKLGIGDVFIKAASYLLHGAAFSQTRDFLLSHGASIVQDDTGIPLRFLEQRKWGLHPFGEYVGPIPLFSGHYQRGMQVLFHRRDAPSIDFGVGYRWRPNQSHVLLAVNRDAPAPAAAVPQPAPALDVQRATAVEKPGAAARDETAGTTGVAGEIGKAEGVTADKKVDSAVWKRPATAIKTAENGNAIALSWLFVQALMIGCLIWGVLAFLAGREGTAGRS